MKKLLLGSAISLAMVVSASAADLYVKAPPPPPVWSWTGCYFGGNLGRAWDHISTVRTGQLGNPFTPQDYGSDDGSAFVGGGQVGCDYQIGSWVIGVQGLFDGGNINSSHVIPPFPTFSYNSTVRDFFTVTGRLGYAVAPSGLIYLKAGGAGTRDHLTVTIPSAAFLSEFADVNFTGWTVGGGLEWHFMSNLSAFVEYNYMDFGTNSVTFTTAPGAVGAPDIINHRQYISALLVGINLRCCGGVPVPTKY